MKKIKCVHLAGIILIILIIFPMLTKGIMCNDELLLRLWAQKGMGFFFETTIVNENIQKGRVLGVLGNVKFLAYFSDNKYIFGTVNAIVILSAVGLFGYFTYKLWKNKSFSALLSVLILVFMPMNFEFGVPNAFVIVTLQPMILLEISLIFYLGFLEKGKKKNRIISIIMFLWAMFLYEFIITYVLLFPLIYLIKNCGQNISVKYVCCVNFPYMAAALIYLIMYVGQGYVFPSNYEGTQLNIMSLAAIAQVLKILFISAFPTYFSYFNAKYKFLFEYYNHGGVKAENIIDPIIVIIIISLACLLIYFFNEGAIIGNEKGAGLKDALIIAAAFMYALLPALPNALTPMYQSGVTVEYFTWIPVSIYLYFAVMFALTYVLWKIITLLNKKWLAGMFTAAILITAGGTQIRNQVFVKEQMANYDRLVAIEDVLKIDYWKQYGRISVSAPSLYETKNSLAIEQGHWSQYAAIYNNELILDDNYNADSSANMVIQDDHSFYWYFNNVELLITKETKSGDTCLRDVLGRYKIACISDCIWNEEEYKVYSLISNDIQQNKTEMEENT